jgi:HK97 family phage prohead protease
MPFEVIKEQCNMESGEAGQAMIYKLEGDERIPFACHADEASAYAVIAAIEAEEEADKNIDELLAKMEELMEEEPEMMADEMPEDQMQEEEMIEESKAYDLGDMVQFMYDGELCTGVVENIDQEANVYTVRKYAVAGDEYEPTDKLYNLSGEELMPVTEEDMEDDTLEGEASMTEEDLPKEMTEEELPKSNGRIMAKMRQIKMEIVDGEDDIKVGVIEGYASTYGNTDLGGDVVEKGAFTQTLKHKNNSVPLLLDHGYKTTDIAGIAFLEDDEKGLYLKAEMPLDIPEVANAYKKTKFMIERGGKMGLSIGYDTIKSLPGEDGTRRLKELALHEVSITPFPMNTEAQIMAAKARKSAVQPKPKNVTRRKAVTLLQNEEFSSFVDEIKQLITSLKES